METEGQQVNVVVAYAFAPREVHELFLHLSAISTVADALTASGLSAMHPELDLEQAPVSIWGRKADRGQVLRAGDRVEVCQPLRVDPKIARRERFAKQGAKMAGLFAQRRFGAKAGY
jgi:putative ubiquitin-RnfH superfamily antitoxin RatB of RatAB toxin-antitoxin module